MHMLTQIKLALIVQLEMPDLELAQGKWRIWGVGVFTEETFRLVSVCPKSARFALPPCAHKD